MPDSTHPTRTPYCHKVRYGVTSAPVIDESHMDGSYAPGIGVSPVLVELVYSAARDGKPASVNATVNGWWMRHGERVQPEGKVDVYFADGPDGWPAWMAEEARLHDPAVVPVPPSADRATLLREAALADDLRYMFGYKGPRHAHEKPGVWDTSGKPCVHCARLAVAHENLAAYDAGRAPRQPTDEEVAEAHRLALSFALGLGTGAPWDAIRERAAELAEAPQPETEAHPSEHTWAAELHDPLADEWVPGTRYIARDRAVNALAHAKRIGPTWKDGTPTQRRLVRATTTYSVEQPDAAPAVVAQTGKEAQQVGCDCPNEDAVEHQFGGKNCDCIPFTRQFVTPRYCGPNDTVDQISGWEIGRTCPHHRYAIEPKP
ncbi:hypothetical protein ACWD4O_39000 [Streptomyces sp. NPDC002623]